jgi:murein DD-endopeptidase
MDRRELIRSALAIGASAAFSTAASAISRDAIDVQIPHAPSPVRVEGGLVLLYELHLTNFARNAIRVKSLSVRAANGDWVLARFTEEELRKRTAIIGENTGDALLAPGRRAVVYIELAARDRLPRRLNHEIELQIGDSPDTAKVRHAGIDVRPMPAAAFDPPLKGGPWVAIYSAEWPRGHRRVFYAVDGRAILPGRFAIDWVRVDDEGRDTKGDADRVNNHLGYGAEVLAVADGEIVATRDTVKEAATVSGNPKHDLEEAAGNYVVLALPDGRFVIYEHLQPASIKVRAGERVRSGQVLGRLGFTGDSTGPHLHLHVADAPAPLIGDGMPYHFKQFTLLGRYEDLGKLGSARWQSTPPNARRDELPPSNSVVTFPSR